MDDSMAYPGEIAAPDLPGWKNAVSHLCALATAILFGSAGVWKLLDPIAWSAKLVQLKVDGAVALPFAIALGIAETFTAVLILVPRFRRWGAWLAAALLAVFMLYVGLNYEYLTGADCSCFPWLKRTIGPGFFAGDAVMLLLAGLAGWWAHRSNNLKAAAIVLISVGAFAAAAFGVAHTRRAGAVAPASVMVEGKPVDLTTGKVFIYFFDPECSHCFAAAQVLGKHKWQDARIVNVPTRVPQFAAGFLQMTGLTGAITSDVEKLKQAFPHGDPPYGVAVEDGRQTAGFAIFDEAEPAATLRKLNFIE